MDTRKIFENYWTNKSAVVIYDGLIAERKLELMPSMTPFLSHAPKGRGEQSSVEKTVLRFEEDEHIQAYLKKQKRAENEIEMVERLLNVLSPKSREIIERRYLDMETVENIAESLLISESKVIRVINNTFQMLDKVGIFFE